MGKQIRKLVLSLVVLICVGAWINVVVTVTSTDDLAARTIAATIAALATEALIWALAMIAGWSIFANRKAFWARLTGKRKSAEES
ncbi:MAG: hypothetical protein GYB36_00300 [Alphaproteobacteria bacterium]|nr:hypothetical protein [Alphaproteobacteria bacterium]